MNKRIKEKIRSYVLNSSLSNHFTLIGIGGGLTAAALPHHRTYGSVSGGSNRLDRSTYVSREGEKPSFGKEFVRHCQLESFHIRHGPGTLSRDRGYGGLFRIDPEPVQALESGLTAFEPLLGYGGPQSPTNPAIQVR